MRRKLLSLFLVVIILTACTSFFFCADRSYKINGFDVNAELDSSGNMRVEERITYNFEGLFHGVYRTLYNTGADGISDISVTMNDGTSEVPFENNDSETDFTYQLLPEGNGTKIKIYSESEDVDKTFIIRYTVQNVATRYNDTGELYWKFMGDETEVVIRDFNVNITLPDGAAMDSIKVFAHGPLSGTIYPIDNRRVEMKVDKLLPHNMVEARILFPTSLIEGSARLDSRDALPGIMAEEKKWSDQSNREILFSRIVVFGTFIFALFQIWMIFFLYFKYDREFKPEFDGEYYRELPGDYTPAELSVLWNFSKISPKDITATLMDLVRRKYLLMAQESIEKKGLFGSKSENEYQFSLNPEKNKNELKRHEQHLVDWLIGTIGDGTSVRLDQIEDYAKTKSEAQIFKSDYDAWVEQVKLDAEQYNFFDKSTVKGTLIGIFTGLIGFGLGVMNMVVFDNLGGFGIMILTSSLLIVYSALIKRRSLYGVDQYKRWKAFKRFLKDFSAIDKAQLPAVIMWEHYLVYAITLGVAEEVIKQLKVVFREEDFNNNGLTFMYYGAYGHHYNHFDNINNITHTIARTTESTYQHAMSQLSSSSGSGGGFSGGGGGGGGGGGAGAF